MMFQLSKFRIFSLHGQVSNIGNSNQGYHFKYVFIIIIIIIIIIDK
jgi:hypothetical protein